MLDTAKNIINTAAEKNVDLLLAPDSVIVPTDKLRQRVEEEKVKLQHPDLRQSVFLASTSAQKSTKAGAEAKKGTKIDLHTASPTGLGRTTKNHDEQLFQEERAEESALKAQEEVSEATNAAREAARMCGSGEIPVGWTGVDVGECTVPAFCKELKGANTILWIGPIGMCEIEDYSQGTMDLINYLAHLDASSTTTIVCGGHTTALLDRTDYSKTFSQVCRVLDTELLQLLERQHNGGLPQGRNGGVKEAAPNVASTLLDKSDLMT